MKIITSSGAVDTNKDAIILLFSSDDELNDFITTLATTHVKTSGLRILPFIPEGKALTPLQVSLLNIINGLDGVNGSNEKINESILDESIEGIEEIIKQTK